MPKWHLIQHRDQRALPLPAASDSPLRCLEDELYERLYSGECDRLPESETDPAVRAWADRIHASFEQLPSFSRLAAECRGDPAVAAAAVEKLLDELGDLLSPDAPPSTPQPGSSKDPLRRPLAAACAAASRSIEELREAMEGLSAVALGAGTGTDGACPPNWIKPTPVLRADRPPRRSPAARGALRGLFRRYLHRRGPIQRARARPNHLGRVPAGGPRAGLRRHRRGDRRRACLRDQAAALGVSVFGLAIGMPSEILAPWCDEAHAVTDLSTVEGKVASAVFA